MLHHGLRCSQTNPREGGDSPGPVDIEAVDVEGQERDDVGEDAESHGQAQTSRQPHVPQDHLNEGGQQVDVAWWTWQRVSV